MGWKSKAAQQKAAGIANEQKSNVQEVIAAARHLCIFLPKFHCELNFIELFYGQVKKYLW